MINRQIISDHENLVIIKPYKVGKEPATLRLLDHTFSTTLYHWDKLPQVSV